MEEDRLLFRASTKDVEELTKLFRAITPITSDVIYFHVKSDGIDFVDTAKIHDIATAVILRREVFDTYEVKKSFILPLNVVGLFKIFNCANKGDSVLFEYENDSEWLTIIVSNADFEAVSRFDLHLKPNDYEPTTMLSENIEVDLDIASSDFYTVCSDLSLFGDETVTISVDENYVSFIGGEAPKTGEIRIPTKSRSIRVDMKAPFSSNFFLWKLNYFSGAKDLSKYVNISMGRLENENVPFVCVTHKFSGLSCKLSFYVVAKSQSSK